MARSRVATECKHVQMVIDSGLRACILFAAQFSLYFSISIVSEFIRAGDEDLLQKGTATVLLPFVQRNSRRTRGINSAGNMLNFCRYFTVHAELSPFHFSFEIIRAMDEVGLLEKRNRHSNASIRTTPISLGVGML